MNQELITRSAKETMDQGRRFASQLQRGDIVCLRGDLGAGKTTWVKGLAEGLGLSANESVTSPTFALMHRYASRIPLYHFDCYRIHSPEELIEIGFEEFVNDRDAVICIEWPEKAGALIPATGWNVSISHQGSDERLIQIQKR